MNIKQLFHDEDAVSPVIGVILMVAITVILAAVIGTFVLGLGDQVQSSAPNANFQFEYPNDWDGDGVMIITHNGGEDVDPSNLQVQAGSVTRSNFNGTAWTSNSISTGDSEIFTQNDTSGAVATATGFRGVPSGGDSVRVIWQSPNGDSSNTIGSSTIPS